jgi:hypothetical protein
MMALLEPGIRVRNAPQFHCARPWGERLRLNSGVEVVAGRVLPRDDWRPPSLHEAALLIAADDDPADALVLFSIPERLRAWWWDCAAEGTGGGDAGGAAFRQFAGEVLDFLHFKRLPLPPACSLEVMVRAPGQPSTRPPKAGLTASRADNPMCAAINLGDEDAVLVFLNLGEAQLAARPDVPGRESFHERAEAFLTGHRDYPLTAVVLRPGEGFRLPRGPLVADGDTRGRTEIDVQLVISTSAAGEPCVSFNRGVT